MKATLPEHLQSDLQMCETVGRVRVFVFGLVQQTVAASLTDLERKNLRRAMYSREAVRTEEEEEGERLPTCEDDCVLG